MERFTRPRLMQVVTGEDNGGISTRRERVAVADLPDGVSPDDAQKFITLLGEFASAGGVETGSLKALRATAKRGRRPASSGKAEEASPSLAWGRPCMRWITKMASFICPRLRYTERFPEPWPASWASGSKQAIQCSADARAAPDWP